MLRNSVGNGTITFWEESCHDDAEQKDFDEEHPCSLNNGAFLIGKLSSCGVEASEGNVVTDVYKNMEAIFWLVSTTFD